MEYYSAIKESAVRWMKLEVIVLSEIRQTQKDKKSMFSLICGN
jgi:hypothetical protein